MEYNRLGVNAQMDHKGAACIYFTGNAQNGVNIYGYKYGARNPNCPSLFFSYLDTHDNDLLVGKTTDNLIRMYNDEIAMKKK